jgi:hypothetical protein
MHYILRIKIHANKSVNSKTTKRTFGASKNTKKSSLSCNLKYDDIMERIFDRRNI